MIVVDTNVIAYLRIAGEHTDLAERLLQHDAAWAAPMLWRSEFCNVLVNCLRQRRFDLTVASKMLANAEEQMQGNEYAVPSAEVLRLAATSDCSAYDCEFVAVAMELAVPLVTFDKQLLSAFPKVACRPQALL